MKKYLLVPALLLLFSSSVFSQIFEQQEVNANRWRLVLTSAGNWGYRYTSANAGGEFPVGSGNYLIYAGGISLGVLKNPSGTTPYDRYSVSLSDFDPEFGPGSIVNENVPFDDLEIGTHGDGGVFVIDATGAGADYVSWSKTPGAPFNDSRHPGLVSDQDSWTVFNDANLSRHDIDESPLAGIGVEVRQSTYMWTLGSTLSDVVFLHWRITNKTDVTYDSVFFGPWSDVDIGDAANDLIGSDTLRNMLYFYNASPENTPTGYQYSTGQKLLYASSNGNENARMFSAQFALLYEQLFVPSDAAHYWTLMGLTRDGTFWPACCVAYPGCRFLFPGDPVTGTGILAESYMPGGRDIRGLIGVGPFVLQPGKTEDFIFALIGAEGESRDSSILKLREIADALDFIFPEFVLPKLNLDRVKTDVSISILHNPETGLKNRLKFYITGDEPLSGGTLTFQTDASTTTETLDYLDGSDNVFFSEFNLESAGILELTARAADLNGNISNVQRTFSTGKFIPGEPLTVTTHDEVLAVRFPPGFSDRGFPVLVGNDPASQSPERLVPATSAYTIYPEVVSGQSSFILQFEIPTGFKPASENERYAVYRLDGEFWRRIGGQLAEEIITAATPDFGTYRVFLENVPVPDQVQLHQNYPNPFNPNTTIRYQLPSDTKVSLTIYNLLGQQVRAFLRGPQSAGEYTVEWNGKNDIGKSVASGVYVYRIKAGDFVQARKTVLIR